jgi:hypothetical protein
MNIAILFFRASLVSALFSDFKGNIELLQDTEMGHSRACLLLLIEKQDPKIFVQREQTHHPSSATVMSPTFARGDIAHWSKTIRLNAITDNDFQNTHLHFLPSPSPELWS